MSAARTHVAVFLEQREGKWNRVAFEALAAGQKLAQEIGGQVSGIVMGTGVDALASEAAMYGLQTVFHLEDPALAEYTADAYTIALQQFIEAVKPDVVVFPHTYQVRDYAPKLATRFGKVLLSDVVDVKAEAGNLTFVRQLFGGKLSADVRSVGQPQFISIQAGAFRAAVPSGSTGSIQRLPLHIDSADVHSTPEPPFREAQRSVDLNSANVIVAVGRGIRDKDALPMVQELANTLGAEIAASRPVCDNGWLPLERQVGSSGQTVSAKVYIALGISGAIQHLVGMKSCKTVIAINKDESAPIFEISDYGIVGDLFEVVPAMLREIKKVKA